MKLKSKRKIMLSSLLALFTVSIIGFSNSYQVKAEDDVAVCNGMYPGQRKRIRGFIYL